MLQEIYAELTGECSRAYKVKVRCNVKYYAPVELGAVLLLKLNGIFLPQIMSATVLLFYSKELVKLTPACTMQVTSDIGLYLQLPNCD